MKSDILQKILEYEKAKEYHKGVNGYVHWQEGRLCLNYDYSTDPTAKYKILILHIDGAETWEFPSVAIANVELRLPGDTLLEKRLDAFFLASLGRDLLIEIENVR